MIAKRNLFTYYFQITAWIKSSRVRVKSMDFQGKLKGLFEERIVGEIVLRLTWLSRLSFLSIYVVPDLLAWFH